MHGTWRDTHPYLFNTFFEGDDGSGAGGDGGAPPEGSQGGGDGGGGKSLTQADVDRIVQDRVGQTKRTTEEAIAKQLGVSIEEAKRIIGEHTKRTDAEKTEAQREKDAAEAARRAADEEKATAAKERHDAAVERALLRALPKDLEDDELDKKVTRIAKLLDVEPGADAAAIAKAVADLKKDEPLLFGAATASEGEGDGGGKKVPDSDPQGKPPVQKKGEDAFSRGQERAKAATGAATYALLDKS